MTRHARSPTFAAIASAGALATALSHGAPAAAAPSTQDVPGRAGVFASCGALVDATGAKVSPRSGGERIATSTSRGCAAPEPAIPVPPTPRQPELAVPVPPAGTKLEPATPVVPTARAREPVIPIPPTLRKAEAVRPSSAVPGLSADAAARSPIERPNPLEFAADNPERVGVALVTGGAVLWMLKSGLLTSLLMLGVPVWRHVDLLPIVTAAQSDGTDEQHPQPGSEDAAVARVLGTREAEAGGASPP